MKIETIKNILIKRTLTTISKSICFIKNILNINKQYIMKNKNKRSNR